MKNLLQNRLMQLYRDNPTVQADRAVRVVANAGEDTATVYCYAPIGDYFGIAAEDFAKQLMAITAPNITLRMDCPGGDVFAARAMAAAVREHPATVTCQIDGLCASAATYLACASDVVAMGPGSFWMIHNSWSVTIGDAMDHMNAHDLLVQIDATIVAEYVRASGQTSEQIVAWMEAETWFAPQAAVDAGFANSVIDTAASTNAANWNLSVFKNAPKIAKPNPTPKPHDIEQMARRLELREKLRC